MAYNIWQQQTVLHLEEDQSWHGHVAHLKQIKIFMWKNGYSEEYSNLYFGM